MNLTPLLFAYAAILLFSSCFAGYLWLIHGARILRLTFFLWISIFAGFVAQGIFNNLELTGFLAFSFNIITVIILLWISESVSENQQLPTFNLVLLLVSSLVISSSLLVSGFDYTVSTMPFSIACGVALFFGAFYRKPRSSLEIGYRLILVITGLHFFDYPFLRVKPELAMIGFSMSLVLTICHSIIVPLLALKTLADRHANELEKKVLEKTQELKDSNLLLHSANAALLEKNLELDHAVKENKMLLNVIVHDLNTPLHALEGTIARMKLISPDAKDYDAALAQSDRAAKAIQKTVEHAAALHNVKSGREKVNIAPVALAPLAESARIDFAEILTVKALTLVIHCESNIEVLADGLRLKGQVLDNLISNAIKYSHPGGEVHVSITRQTDSAFIQVRDFGIGVPTDRIADIFALKGRNSTLGTYGEKGLGIGLSIVFHYTRLMGGEVRFISPTRDEPGACFEVKLKLSEPSERAAAAPK